MTDQSEITAQQAAVRAFLAQHRIDYLSSGGTKGHVLNLAATGGLSLTTTLLLRTIGRKSGEARTLPLIYGNVRGEIVVVASKGGAPQNPAWYLNMRDGGEVGFQIATQAFRASWREPQGAERKEVWDYMEAIFPPYEAYQAATDRLIPIVMLTALEPIDIFRE